MTAPVNTVMILTPAAQQAEAFLAWLLLLPWVALFVIGVRRYRRGGGS